MTALSWQAADIYKAIDALGGRLPTGERGPVATVEGLGFSRLVASVGLLELVGAGAVEVAGEWVTIVGVEA